MQRDTGLLLAHAVIILTLSALTAGLITHLPMYLAETNHGLHTFVFSHGFASTHPMWLLVSLPLTTTLLGFFITRLVLHATGTDVSARVSRIGKHVGITLLGLYAFTAIAGIIGESGFGDLAVSIIVGGTGASLSLYFVACGICGALAVANRMPHAHA